jgi:uncharacterized protein YndB with AHSA1/START domain
MSQLATIKGHSIHRTVRVEAGRDAVWAALTEPELLARWMGESATLTALEVGATGVIGYEDFGDFPFRVTAVEPTSVFEYRWSGEPADSLDDNNSTVVRFTLDDDDTATLVTVVESGFNTISGGTAHRRARLEQNRDGWNVELDDLVAHFED